MNNMTEKIIKDGSERKRAQYNKISSALGGSLLLLGILLLVVKGLSVEYIDAEGMLHENLFLIPAGFLCIFSGVISFVTVGIRTILGRLKGKK